MMQPTRSHSPVDDTLQIGKVIVPECQELGVTQGFPLTSLIKIRKSHLHKKSSASVAQTRVTRAEVHRVGEQI